MTSYQELASERENSFLFIGGYRPREAGIRQLDHNSGLSNGKEGNLEVVSEVLNPHCDCDCENDVLPVPLNTASPLSPSLDFSPPPACLHYPRVPLLLTAQEFPGLGYASSTSNTRDETHCDFGQFNAHFQLYTHDRPKIHFAVVDSSSADPKCTLEDVNQRSKTFEWMKVKRSQPRAGR